MRRERSSRMCALPWGILPSALLQRMLGTGSPSTRQLNSALKPCSSVTSLGSFTKYGFTAHTRERINQQESTLEKGEIRTVHREQGNLGAAVAHHVVGHALEPALVALAGVVDQQIAPVHHPDSAITVKTNFSNASFTHKCTQRMVEFGRNTSAIL